MTSPAHTLLDFVSKWTRIAQIAVNIFLWCWFSRFDSFYRSRLFYFVTRSFEFRLKFWAPKAAFWRNSVIIDLLVNKSIFRQTKYLVICFTLHAYLTWEYEQNLFFGCCRDILKIFHFWAHSLLILFTSFLKTILWEKTDRFTLGTASVAFIYGRPGSFLFWQGSPTVTHF